MPKRNLGPGNNRAQSASRSAGMNGSRRFFEFRGPAEKPVEAAVSSGASEEVAVRGHCYFREAPDTEAVVQKVELWLKPQNGFFEGLRELPPRSAVLAGEREKGFSKGRG